MSQYYPTKHSVEIYLVQLLQSMLSKCDLSVTDDLKALVLSLEARVGQLEGGKPAAKAAPAPAKAAPAPAEEEDDDVDLFGSSDEEESEEKKRITEERLKAYHEKKSKKPTVIAKTSVLLDVKVSIVIQIIFVQIREQNCLRSYSSHLLNCHTLAMGR